jgi:hypothetical protein
MGTNGFKLIKKAKVPVVPMYFHAKNSRILQHCKDSSRFANTYASF